MEVHKLISYLPIFLLALLAVSYEGVLAHNYDGHQNRFRPGRLFVFGDSYADTGNQNKSSASSWKVPYGITFPGKPAGRFSDGRVLTDYLARFYGLKSPVPYEFRKLAGMKRLKDGMNFAYGGTGVFDTQYSGPNMTAQIDLFNALVDESVYSKWDLQTSMAVIALSGNDYSAFLLKGGLFQNIPAFITQVVNQLTVNLKRLHGLGLRKVAIASLQPLGCLPRTTILNSFQQCNATENSAVDFHNLLLRQAVAKLNNETAESAFFVLDLYSSFNTVLKNKGDFLGEGKFETPLKPCCMGINASDSCGSLNDKGEKMYTLCKNPKSSFFWDMVHPTQTGWRAIYLTLRSSLQQIN